MNNKKHFTVCALFGHLQYLYFTLLNRNLLRKPIKFTENSFFTQVTNGKAHFVSTVNKWLIDSCLSC